MKALKYGIALMLGLGMLGCGARAFAQASGQTREVTPANPTPLADVAPAATQSRPDSPKPLPERGIPTPRAIEDMVTNKQFAKAVSEFEKYMKTAQGTPCDLIFLPFTFYNRLLMEDTANPALYQEKVRFYVDKFLQTCGDTYEAYVLKDNIIEPRVPDSTVVWMTAAIKLEPKDPNLYISRGYALWQLGKTKEACADYAKAKELDAPFYGDYYDMQCAGSDEASEENQAQ